MEVKKRQGTYKLTRRRGKQVVTLPSPKKKRDEEEEGDTLQM